MTFFTKFASVLYLSGSKLFTEVIINILLILKSCVDPAVESDGSDDVNF